MSDTWCWVQEVFAWDSVTNVLNSVFTVSVVGSLSGAFAGAYAVQKIIERQQRRQALRSEIHNTNAAISIAFEICNSALSLKKQHLVDMKQEFDFTRIKAEQHKFLVDSGQTQGLQPFKFRADMRTLPELALPTKTLRLLVFEKLSGTGRALSAVISLLGTEFSFNRSIRQRNRLIENKKPFLTPADSRVVNYYFGFRNPDGSIDTEFPDLFNAIYDYTDDLIFFAKLICDDLKVHGHSLLEKLSKPERKQLPKINSVDFEMAFSEGLMPDENKYSSWLAGIQKTK